MSTASAATQTQAPVNAQSFKEQWENLVKQHSDKVGWCVTAMFPIVIVAAFMLGFVNSTAAVVCGLGWLAVGLMIKKVVSSILFTAAARVSKGVRLAIAISVSSLLVLALVTNPWAWAWLVTTLLVLGIFEWTVRQVAVIEEEELIQVPPAQNQGTV